jgi:RNA polymerase sigma factor (sigma-70 family)
MNFERDVVPWINRFAERHARKHPAVDVDECVQRASIAALERINTWDPEQSGWKTYLYHTVRFAFLQDEDYQRARGRQNSVHQSGQLDLMAVDDSELTRVDDREELDTLIESLDDPIDRDIIQRIRMGDTIEEAAEAMGRSYESVRRRYNKAVAQMGRKHRR